MIAQSQNQITLKKRECITQILSIAEACFNMVREDVHINTEQIKFILFEILRLGIVEIEIKKVNISRKDQLSNKIMRMIFPSISNTTNSTVESDNDQPYQIERADSTDTRNNNSMESEGTDSKSTNVMPSQANMRKRAKSRSPVRGTDSNSDTRSNNTSEDSKSASVPDLISRKTKSRSPRRVSDCKASSRDEKSSDSCAQRTDPELPSSKKQKTGSDEIDKLLESVSDIKVKESIKQFLTDMALEPLQSSVHEYAWPWAKTIPDTTQRAYEEVFQYAKFLFEQVFKISNDATLTQKIVSQILKENISDKNPVFERFRHKMTKHHAPDYHRWGQASWNCYELYNRITREVFETQFAKYYINESKFYGNIALIRNSANKYAVIQKGLSDDSLKEHTDEHYGMVLFNAQVCFDLMKQDIQNMEQAKFIMIKILESAIYTERVGSEVVENRLKELINDVVYDLFYEDSIAQVAKLYINESISRGYIERIRNSIPRNRQDANQNVEERINSILSISQKILEMLHDPDDGQVVVQSESEDVMYDILQYAICPNREDESNTIKTGVLEEIMNRLEFQNNFSNTRIEEAPESDPDSSNKEKKVKNRSRDRSRNHSSRSSSQDSEKRSMIDRSRRQISDRGQMQPKAEASQSRSATPTIEDSKDLPSSLGSHQHNPEASLEGGESPEARGTDPAKSKKQKKDSDEIDKLLETVSDIHVKESVKQLLTDKALDPLQRRVLKYAWPLAKTSPDTTRDSAYKEVSQRVKFLYDQIFKISGNIKLTQDIMDQVLKENISDKNTVFESFRHNDKIKNDIAPDDHRWGQASRNCDVLYDRIIGEVFSARLTQNSSRGLPRSNSAESSSPVTGKGKGKGNLVSSSSLKSENALRKGPYSEGEKKGNGKKQKIIQLTITSKEHIEQLRRNDQGIINDKNCKPNSDSDTEFPMAKSWKLEDPKGTGEIVAVSIWQLLYTVWDEYELRSFQMTAEIPEAVPLQKWKFKWHLNTFKARFNDSNEARSNFKLDRDMRVILKVMNTYEEADKVSMSHMARIEEIIRVVN